MAIDRTALAAELANDPLSLGYAQWMTPRDDVRLADLLNAPRGTRAVSRLCCERTILTEYGGGPIAADQVLGKLEAYAASTGPLSSITARAMRYVKQPDGLDLGSAVTAEMLGALVQASVITADESAKLVAIASQPSSRALDLFGAPASFNDVSDALNSKDAA